MLSLVFITIIPVQTILLSNTLAFCILMEIVTEFKRFDEIRCSRFFVASFW